MTILQILPLGKDRKTGQLNEQSQIVPISDKNNAAFICCVDAATKRTYNIYNLLCQVNDR